MFKIMLLLHVIGAAGMGFYLILPALVGKVTKLTGAGQEGLAAGLSSANRIAQYFLIVQLLTGGYLMSQSDYSVAWMIIATVGFLAIAALGGIASKPLKLIGTSIRDGQSAAAHIGKARTLSFIILIIYVVILYFMVNPIYK
ncbi:conserved hypothetical protein [Paenibacillus curdlanolyticus YK9]|uniref:DUF2269 family protein n=1 Tax=Paenibacillus curdlanolyticus YK9 TaxID=717606 RepID=E0IDM5_9BACL|nr:hypothetical protein [Paenibacillus curdlanolyticus]EFM09229.1 conserved hypothetical protein [Paenibacillus curdlanolyticus YK9]